MPGILCQTANVYIAASGFFPFCLRVSAGGACCCIGDTRLQLLLFYLLRRLSNAKQLASLFLLVFCRKLLASARGSFWHLSSG
jgi:hypothetical protein